MNRILALAVITVVTAIMGLSMVAPAIADHGLNNNQLCNVAEIFDPNTNSCIPEDSCPNGISFDGGIHCSLDTNRNDNQKVVLCHQPSKSNGDPITIEVSSKAVEKHLAHGDTLGAC